MRPAIFYFLLGVAVTIASSDPTWAGKALNAWPICSEAYAVNPATAAHRKLNKREVEELGCLVNTPKSLWVLVLRCDALVLDRHPTMFSYPIERDEMLPDSVCQIGVSLPDGWRALLYTHIFNITKAW